MKRGGSLKMRAAALLLGLVLAALAAASVLLPDPFGPGPSAQDSVTTVIVDTGSSIYLYTHDTCRSIFAAASPDPQGACDCMTPILMQRLTPEARERIEADPDQLPFGVTLFRDATPEEEAAQRACME